MPSQRRGGQFRSLLTKTTDSGSLLRAFAIEIGVESRTSLPSEIEAMTGTTVQRPGAHSPTRSWSLAEEDLLRRKADELGRRRTSIQAAFPGRTDINVKNRWKQMKKMDWAYRQGAALAVGP